VEIQELPFVKSPMPLVQNTSTDVNRWEARTVAEIRSHLERGKGGEQTKSSKPTKTTRTNVSTRELRLGTRTYLLHRSNVKTTARD